MFTLYSGCRIMQGVSFVFGSLITYSERKLSLMQISPCFFKMYMPTLKASKCGSLGVLLHIASLARFMRRLSIYESKCTFLSVQIILIILLYLLRFSFENLLFWCTQLDRIGISSKNSLVFANCCIFTCYIFHVSGKSFLRCMTDTSYNKYWQGSELPL